MCKDYKPCKNIKATAQGNTYVIIMNVIKTTSIYNNKYNLLSTYKTKNI